MKITNCFSDLKKKNQPALILYYTAGYPDLEKSMQNIQILADNGADIIEIGIPFSDPVADGPVIQAASQKALENGATLQKILKRLSCLKTKAPLVIMSYLNPLEAFGKNKFPLAAAKAGISGIIIPDLPVEAASDWKESLNNAGLDLIFLTAPNSDFKRIKLITENSSGFVYAVNLLGTTGTRSSYINNSQFIKQVQTASALPVAAGFGISTEDQIRQAGKYADGVIIGSRIMEVTANDEDLGRLVSNFKKAACNARGKAGQ